MSTLSSISSFRACLRRQAQRGIPLRSIQERFLTPRTSFGMTCQGYVTIPIVGAPTSLWSARAQLSLLQTHPGHESSQREPGSRSQGSSQLHNRKSGGIAAALQNVGAPTFPNWNATRPYPRRGAGPLRPMSARSIRFCQRAPQAKSTGYGLAKLGSSNAGPLHTAIAAPTKYRTLMFSGSRRVRLLRRTATLALPGHEFLDARFFGRPQKAIPTKAGNVGAPTFPKWNCIPEVAA